MVKARESVNAAQQQGDAGSATSQYGSKQQQFSGMSALQGKQRREGTAQQDKPGRQPECQPAALRTAPAARNA